MFQGGHISHLQLAQLAAAGHHPALMTQLPAVFAAAHAPQQQVMPTASAAMAAAAAASIAYNNPCSTLFVANLGPNVNEQELKEIFASFPGFCRLRMHNKNGSPVAFVEYTVRKNVQKKIKILKIYIKANFFIWWTYLIKFLHFINYALRTAVRRLRTPSLWCRCFVLWWCGFALWRLIFQDVRQAIQAMSSLQGFTLLSSDRGGIRIEFAKHKMGEVRTPFCTNYKFADTLTLNIQKVVWLALRLWCLPIDKKFLLVNVWWCDAHKHGRSFYCPTFCRMKHLFPNVLYRCFF